MWVLGEPGVVGWGSRGTGTRRGIRRFRALPVVVFVLHVLWPCALPSFSSPRSLPLLRVCLLGAARSTAVPITASRSPLQGFDEYMNLVLDDAAEVDSAKKTNKPVGAPRECYYAATCPLKCP